MECKWGQHLWLAKGVVSQRLSSLALSATLLLALLHSLRHSFSFFLISHIRWIQIKGNNGVRPLWSARTAVRYFMYTDLEVLAVEHSCQIDNLLQLVNLFSNQLERDSALIRYIHIEAYARARRQTDTHTLSYLHYTLVHAHTHTWIYTNKHIHVLVVEIIHAHNTPTHSPALALALALALAHVHARARTHTHQHTHTHTHIRTHPYKYHHFPTHTRLHTNTHTHTYTRSST